MKELPSNFKKIKSKYIINTDDILSFDKGIIIYVLPSNNYIVDPLQEDMDRKVGGMIKDFLYNRTHRLLFNFGIISREVSDKLYYVGVVMGSVTRNKLFVPNNTLILLSIRMLYSFFVSKRPIKIYILNNFTNLFHVDGRKTTKQDLDNLKLTIFNYFHPSIFFVEDSRVISPVIEYLNDFKAQLIPG